MESLIVILSLLALSSISSAAISGILCDPEAASLKCPNEGGIFANCNTTSEVLVWEASLNGDSPFVVELNFSDSTQINESVILSGVEVTFAKIGSGASFVFILSPNASLNGLELTCTDSDNTSMTGICTLENFFDSSDLPPPQNLAFNFSSITDNSINYSWDPPSDSHNCSSGVYSVRIRVNGTSQLFYATQPSGILVEIAENREHCVSVAQIGNDFKPGMYTPDECITIDTPTPVVIADPTYDPMYKSEDMDPTMADITMNWMYVSDTRPPVTQYYVTNNFYPYESSGSGDAGEPTENPDVIRVFEPTRNQLIFEDVQLGREYTFSVIAENILGNGSEAVIMFTAELPLRPTPSTPTVAMTQTAMTSATPSTTPTEGEDTTTLPVWGIAVIAVGGAIILAVILAVVVILFCVCCGKAARAKKREEHELRGTKM